MSIDWEEKLDGKDIEDFMWPALSGESQLMQRIRPEGEWKNEDRRTATEICHKLAWIEDNLDNLDFAYRLTFQHTGSEVELFFYKQDVLDEDGQRVIHKKFGPAPLMGRVGRDAGQIMQHGVSGSEVFDEIMDWMEDIIIESYGY